QNERSQHKNRAMAMKILRSRLYELEIEKQKEKMETYHKTKKEIAWGSQIRSYVLHPTAWSKITAPESRWEMPMPFSMATLISLFRLTCSRPAKRPAPDNRTSCTSGMGQWLAQALFFGQGTFFLARILISTGGLLSSRAGIFCWFSLREVWNCVSWIGILYAAEGQSCASYRINSQHWVGYCACPRSRGREGHREFAPRRGRQENCRRDRRRLFCR